MTATTRTRLLAAALTAMLACTVLATLAPPAGAQVPGNLTWDQAKRLQRYASPAAPSLPAAQPPTRVVADVWDERHSLISTGENGHPRLDGYVQTRAFVAEPIPYLSDYLQYLPADFVQAYQGQVDAINARLQTCASAEGGDFARWINRGYPETKPSYAQLHTQRGLNPKGNAWTECLAGSPDIIICEDLATTPQLDYEQCVPVEAHQRPSPPNTTLERDTWMSDYVSDLMGIPRESEIDAAYGDAFAFDRLYASPNVDTSYHLPATDLPTHLAQFLTDQPAG